ncbi:armadillo-type protein [Gaertneriomyces semiglobifer]|nr:armadillo-type protein [Gaertneriomyces semiglobifer]
MMSIVNNEKVHRTDGEEAVTAGLRRGYRGIPYFGNVEPDEKVPEYAHGPHRKDLMKTVLGRRPRRVSANPAPFLKSDAPHRNPVAAAIDLPYVTQSSKLQVLRRPARLPPSMEAQAKELEQHRKALDAIELENLAQTRVQQQRLELRVDRDAANVLGTFTDGSGMLQVDLRENDQFRPAVRQTLIDGSSPALHKTSWLRSHLPKAAESTSKTITAIIEEKPSIETPSAAKTDTRNTGNIDAVQHRPNPSESFSTRNVPYMLQVWQQAEGVDLHAALTGYARDEIKRRLQSRKNLSQRLSSLADHSRFSAKLLRPSTAGSKRPSSGQSDTRGNRSAGARSGLRVSSAQDMKPKNCLSRSTVKYLRKLTREAMQGQHASMDMAVDSIVRLTLKGPSEFVERKDDRALSAGIKKAMISGRRGRSYTPADYREAIARNALTMSPATDDSLSAALEKRAIEPKESFDLVIPNVIETSDGEDSEDSDADDHPEGHTSDEGALSRPQSRMRSARSRLSSSKSLSKDLRFLKTLGEPTKRESIVQDVAEALRMSIAQAQSQGHTSHQPTNPLSLVNFVNLLKCSNDGTRALGSNLLTSSRGSTVSIASMTKAAHFLETPFTQLAEVPPKGSLAFAVLLKALGLAISSGNSRDLQFEACRLVIDIDAQDLLGLPEDLAFRKLLPLMLREGSPEERAAAAKTLAAFGVIDTLVIQVLRSELGEIHNRRRASAYRALLKLPHSYAEEVLSGLLADAESSSWRVRQDAASLIARWLVRIATASVLGTASEPHDAHEQSDAPNRPIVDYITSCVDDQDPTIPTDGSKRLIREAVETLVKLMWDDWNGHVRDAAAHALGRVGMGSRILNRVMETLSSSDPLKRIGSLKTLTKLSTIYPAAMPSYLECFADEFTAVRLQACKLACVLESRDRSLINALLDRFSDFDWRVRAYAVKAIGQSQVAEPHIAEALRCTICHDSHPSVKAEAIHAASRLGLIASNRSILDAITDVMEIDQSSAVRQEANKALQRGVSQPLLLATTESTLHPTTSTAEHRRPAHSEATRGQRVGQGQASHITDQLDVKDVIDQVRQMADINNVTSEIAQMKPQPVHLAALGDPGSFQPDLKAIHSAKGSKRINAGILVTRKTRGLPHKATALRS